MSIIRGKLINNRYKIEDDLGRGAMAEVYLVWDEDRATHLALKVLRDDLAHDRIFLRRFKREAQTLSKLQHPNIVRFYGLEEWDSHAYILMDYIEGGNLRKEIYQLKGTPMSTMRVRDVMRPVCSALHFAHNKGLVHCDIKPGNIMIDATGKVLVADFGIARMTDSATATMVGAGTPAYMAPEQALGQDPTSATDVYALGIILYEMVTGGERPFTGDNAKAGSTSEKVRWEQLNLDPPSPRVHNPKLSKELEAVILKCLEKEPTDRYQSPLELLNDLEVALGFPSVVASEEDVAELVMEAVRAKDGGDRDQAIVKYNQALEAAPPSMAEDIRTQLADLETGSEYHYKPKKKIAPVWYFGIGAAVIALIIFLINLSSPSDPTVVASPDDDHALETQVAIGVELTEESRLGVQTAVAEALDATQEIAPPSPTNTIAFTPTPPPAIPAGFVEMPDLIGMNVEEAKKLLEELGLGLINDPVFMETGNNNEITDQDPAPGEVIAKGSEVTLSYIALYYIYFPNNFVVQGTHWSMAPVGWQFFAFAGDKCEFRTSQLGKDADTMLRLLNSAGNPIARNDDVSYGKNLRSKLNFTIQANGMYTIQVMPYGEWNTGENAFFTLNVTCS